MSLKYTTLPSLFSAIADEIRTKKGTSDEIVADDFPDEISTISSGGGGSVIPPDLPKDGKTRICYQIPEGTTGDDLVLTLAFTHKTSATQTTVDWGDGSTPVVSTGSGYKELTHAPNTAGTYVATVNVDSGSIRFGGTTAKTVYGAYNKNNAGNVRRFIYWVVVGDDTSFDVNVFYYCTNLTEVVLADGVTAISDSAFHYCTNLASIQLSDTLTSIGSSAFFYCTALKSVTLPDGVTSIGSSAFNYCVNLADIKMPDTLSSVGTTAFGYCGNLMSIEIPSSLTTIDTSVFSNCVNLTNIVIPDTVASIGASAFSSLYGLKKLRFDSTNPPTLSASSAFSNLPTTCIISVPVGSLSAYQTATNYPSSSTYTYIEEA